MTAATHLPPAPLQPALTLTSEELTPLIREWTVNARLPEVREEIKRRLLYRALIEKSEESREKELLKCQSDPVHWFNHWVWTYDPRLMPYGLPANLPFRLRPLQSDMVRWLLTREETQTSGLIEKSRDEGMSYVILGFFLHHWLFVEGFAAGVGSRKEEYVDKKGDPKTLFHKFRDMLYKLPEWMIPEGFTRKEHDNFMRIINPVNGASLTGEAGDNIGRGGRTSMYLLDEWAFHANQEAVDAAISQNTNVRLKGSTPNGVGDRFYNDRFSGKYPVFALPWRENPDKNWTVEYHGRVIHPWYEKQVAELDPVTLAQEVDMDYSASVEGVVIPQKWVDAAFQVQLTPGTIRAGGADVGEENDKSTYAARAGGVVLSSLVQLSGLHVASDLEERARRDRVTTLNYDKLGVGASITATLAKFEDLPFTVRGIANGESPTRTKYEDAEARADERFSNLAAELWWRLRLRFKATYERVTQGTPHPDDECISLSALRGHPLEGAVRAQLSQATYEKTGRADKIHVNKKGNGSKSPDLAEAIMYAFAPPVKVQQVADRSGSNHRQAR